MTIIQNIRQFRQYYKDEPNDNLADSGSFKSEVKITGSTPAGGITKVVKITVPLNI